MCFVESITLSGMRDTKTEGWEQAFASKSPAMILCLKITYMAKLNLWGNQQYLSH